MDALAGAEDIVTLAPSRTSTPYPKRKNDVLTTRLDGFPTLI